MGSNPTWGRLFWGNVKGAASGTWEAVAATCYFAAIMHCVREYVFDITLCSGPSMLPALGVQGNIVFLEAITPRLLQVKVGDIVIANSPNNPSNTVCKRVCGTAGDVVEVAPSHSFQKTRHEVVPHGHVWLQGDNLNNSTDSRTYGAVPLGLIRGRVFCKVWPLSEACIFRTDPTCCGGGELHPQHPVSFASVEERFAGAGGEAREQSKVADNLRD